MTKIFFKTSLLFLGLICINACNNGQTEKINSNTTKDTLLTESISTDSSLIVNHKETDGVDKYEKHLDLNNYLVESIPSNDFLTVDYNAVVFIVPDSSRIAEMKKGNEEDFYTGADDQNYYQYEATIFFESKKLKVLHPENRYIKFKSKTKEIYFDTKAEVATGWTELMFRTDSLPIIFNIVDYETEYKKYYEKN